MSKMLWDLIWSDLKRSLLDLNHSDRSLAAGIMEDEMRWNEKNVKIAADYVIETKVGIESSGQKNRK